MRISDWSSDVCSSDLQRDGLGLFDGVEAHGIWQPGGRLFADFGLDDPLSVAKRGAGCGKVALLRVLVAAAQDRPANVLERVEHDILFDAAAEVLSRGAPPMLTLNVARATKTVMEPLGQSPPTHFPPRLPPTAAQQA